MTVKELRDKLSKLTPDCDEMSMSFYCLNNGHYYSLDLLQYEEDNKPGYRVIVEGKLK